MAMADRMRGTDQNVWVEFGKLAVEHKALNLGQGFPDFHAPESVRRALAAAVLSDNPFMNQYTRSAGHPRLVRALGDTFSPLLRRRVDPLAEVIVTVGAYGALFACVQGLLNPGDEAVIIEPFFDCYEPMVKVAGGTPRFVPLRPTAGGSSSADWVLDACEFESVFSNKTKLLFFNTPLNPLGKIFSRQECEMIAGICKKYDVIVLADEVYEWLTYPNEEHVKIATLPDMWDRTITIGSAGKTFSVTGWKLGWAIGPSQLIKSLMMVHQNSIYTCPTPLQEAVAIGLELELARFGRPECYYKELPAQLLPKREKMAKFLRQGGMEPIIPQGGYFMIADTSKLDIDLDPGNTEPRDYQIVKWLTKNKKLAAIPPSAFYSQEHKSLAKNLIRFCFCKEDSTLEQAEKMIQSWSH